MEPTTSSYGGERAGAGNREPSGQPRKCRRYLYRGSELTIREISDCSGVPSRMIYRRLADGWPPEQAFEKARRQKPKRPKKGLPLIEEQTGIRATTLRARMRKGASMKEAIAQAPRSFKLYSFDGELLPLKAIAARSGLNIKTMIQRLRMGWTEERAFTAPPTRRKERA